MKYIKKYENNIDINEQLIDLVSNNMLIRSSKNINQLISLINNGANPNIKTNLGFTPLSYASSIYFPELVNFLIEKGADPNPKPDVNGKTPIGWACTNNDIDTIITLLDAGADLFCKIIKSGENTYSLDYVTIDNINIIRKKYPELYVKYTEDVNFHNATKIYNL